MNDVASDSGAQKRAAEHHNNRRLRVRRWTARFAVALVLAMVSGSMISVAEAQAAALSAPLLVGPINRSTTTLSVRFYRSAESAGVCMADIGYEFKGGIYATWHDAGGFPKAPCNDPDPGYKFSGLVPATTYVLSVRSYRIIDGVKTDFSNESSISATTL
ncbi:MAG TPA: hypothetical protein PLB21_01550, partial [Actinomycetota bacterium]|nr:hypothetical protein [Actinomycetota bacterium]